MDASSGQIMQLPRSGLSKPDVCPAILFGEKCYEVSIVRQRCGKTLALEFGDGLKLRAREWVGPKVLCSLRPEDRSSGQGQSHRCQDEYEFESICRGASLVRLWPVALGSGTSERCVISIVGSGTKVSTALPSIQFHSRRVYRAHP